ncbi:class I SAM-dependent methyltransferase [Ktedonosporobacter rubrisoli]|uniref:Class I SAM-dependent methyltransferase n=1 Tax=Ktedonosporobacter rubrisoli TaxID=2509675 RepID=A0A4P6JMF8_KTERU|nr:class I SAM-dependent methyltransferase [Ktedonosporobacter rubrisoli]QBD76414.1 class I SAM-dependent methyltransferase [Ktedonosporobacter rubrisoli]
MMYAFTDTDRAIQRLEVLAEVYEPATRAFLHDSIQEAPASIIDLGCGPGSTTRLLAKTFAAAQVTGLDLSERTIAYAQQKATAQVSFRQHDITSVPFPTDPADLLYCRFLLTHLQDPYATLERWCTQLRPGGSLLIEEVEWIQTSNQLFSRYLAIVARMLEQQANQLYIGPELNQIDDTSNRKRTLSRVYHLPVTSRHAATMFWMNIQSWKHNQFIQAHYATQEINQLEEDLHALVETSSADNEIVWGMRQLAFQRLR